VEGRAEPPHPRASLTVFSNGTSASSLVSSCSVTGMAGSCNCLASGIALCSAPRSSSATAWQTSHSELACSSQGTLRLSFTLSAFALCTSAPRTSVTVAVSSAPNASEVSAALAPCPSGACASSEFPGSPTGKLPCTSVACTSVTSDFATRCSSMSAALRSSVSGSTCNVCVTDGFGGKAKTAR